MMLLKGPVMGDMKIAILTSSESWFMPYAKQMEASLVGAKLFTAHEHISSEYEIVFMLSYFRIIEKKCLDLHKHNLVVHESALPKGRGWSPLFWQILEGENVIPICLIEAGEGVDEGAIYAQDSITLEGHELHDEIRAMQAHKTIKMCLGFLTSSFKPIEQTGTPTYYRRRNPTDGELDMDKTIREQFNLLRVVSNEDYPAYFMHMGRKYVLEIKEEGA